MPDGVSLMAKVQNVMERYQVCVCVCVCVCVYVCVCVWVHIRGSVTPSAQCIPFSLNALSSVSSSSTCGFTSATSLQTSEKVTRCACVNTLCYFLFHEGNFKPVNYSSV